MIETTTRAEMSEQGKMTTTEAVAHLRRDPQYADVIRDSYLEADVQAAAERFRRSGEFAEVRAMLGGRLAGGKVLDLGAGTGIASYALAHAGASLVYALEPDASAEVGRGAIVRLCANLPVEVLDAFGERIPLEDETVDIVYARQVLHHTRDLGSTLRECARILRRSGVMLICREHVADDEAQLRQFLSEHPIHRLAGGEHAYPLDAYTAAIEGAGLRVEQKLGPWDSLINAFPSVRTKEEFESFPQRMLGERFGLAGALAARVPFVRPFVWRRIRRVAPPGRLYSFLAVKP
jgi:SAM-dependent methyltransferase